MYNYFFKKGVVKNIIFIKEDLIDKFKILWNKIDKDMNIYIE